MSFDILPELAVDRIVEIMAERGDVFNEGFFYFFFKHYAPTSQSNFSAATM